MGGGGALLSLGSTIAKLAHDKGLHIATIHAAGSDIAAALPKLRQDLAIVQGFVEQDWPGLARTINDTSGKVHELEQKVEAIPGVDELVVAVTAAIRSQLAGPESKATEVPHD